LVRILSGEVSVSDFFRVLIFLALFSIALPSNSDGLAGPIFGLATAPNGDIMVADTAAGIALFDTSTGDAALESPLPGITDISAIGRGSFWVTRTGTHPQGETDSGQALLRVSRGKVRMVANLFQFEVANDPHQAGAPASNPFDVQGLTGGAALVADAAANDVLWVDDEGHVEVIAVFPDEVVSTANIKTLLGCPGSGAGPCFLPPAMPAQPVPTSIAVGPDGYYYVGELKGFPAPVNESRVWRVAPWASWAMCGNSPDCEIVFDGGFTSIIDLAFGPEGLLYVVELDESSWFALDNGLGTGGTINACDLDTLDCVVVQDVIPGVTAITFGKNGNLWSTQYGAGPGVATIIEIP